jgi:hypothetical protein
MGELVVPISVCGNERMLGDTVTVPVLDAPAVPDRATVCGLLLAESLKLSVALRVPVASGLK